MQRLWLKGSERYEPLSQPLLEKWYELRNDIHNVAHIHIPRWLDYADHHHAEFHRFADASELVYAAAVYLKIQRLDDSVAINLKAAKARVALVKRISLPRLELRAA